MLDRRTDLRELERPFFGAETLEFPQGRDERYVIYTAEYAYGVHASHAGNDERYADLDKIHLWLPRNLVAIQERWYFRRPDSRLPDLRGENPDVYMWLHLGVNRSLARVNTYVGQDLLHYTANNDGFAIDVSSSIPVEIHKVRNGENFKWSVLNRRPKT